MFLSVESWRGKRNTEPYKKTLGKVMTYSKILFWLVPLHICQRSLYCSSTSHMFHTFSQSRYCSFNPTSTVAYWVFHLWLWSNVGTYFFLIFYHLLKKLSSLLALTYNLLINFHLVCSCWIYVYVLVFMYMYRVIFPFMLMDWIGCGRESSDF